MFRVTIDEEKCIGCGACTGCDNFEMGDDAKAHVKQAEIDEAGCSKDSADSCPVEAIKVEEM